MARRSLAGFTLIELLIALVVFTTVSLLAYGGLDTVLQAEEATRRHSERLKQLQRAWFRVGQDMTQLVGRGIRDQYGDPQPPLVASELRLYQIEFTRSGWSNPAAQRRSTLQRVAYGVEDGVLLRYSWLMLDRAQGSEPRREGLLTGVNQLRLRYLDSAQNWQTTWPPLSAADVSAIPVAIEVVMDTEQEGEIRRLFRVSAQAS